MITVDKTPDFTMILNHWGKFVELEKEGSDAQTVGIGVLQGSVFGSILLAFIIDLSMQLQLLDDTLFADDTNISSLDPII